MNGYPSNVEALLTEYGERVGEDLSQYHVYGSPMRPMSAVWARIPNAVYMQTEPRKTGFHTYVVVPEPLGQEIINRYQLHFVCDGKASI